MFILSFGNTYFYRAFETHIRILAYWILPQFSLLSPGVHDILSDSFSNTLSPISPSIPIVYFCFHMISCFFRMLYFSLLKFSFQLHDYTRSRGNGNLSDVPKKSGEDWG